MRARGTPRSGRQAAAALTEKFVKAEEWNGLSAGDPVRILGIRGGHWRFRCHVTNAATGSTWVDVAELDVPHRAAGAARRHAGEEVEAERPPPVRRMRSFPEERVVARRGRQRSAPRGPAVVQGSFELGLGPG